MIKDFKLVFDNAGSLISQLWKLDYSKAYRVNIVEWRNKRKLSQNGLQHVIYDEISEYLIRKGRTDWTPKYTKNQMKNNFLGWITEDFTNVLTGEVTTRQVLKKTSDLDTGEAYDYTTRLIDWAHNIGCEIKIPEKCEYRELQDLQNK